MGTISIEQLRRETGAALRRAEGGETMTITRDGAPIATLGPVRLGRQRVVPRERLLALAKDVAPIDAARFRADLDALADPWFDA